MHKTANNVRSVGAYLIYYINKSYIIGLYAVTKIQIWISLPFESIVHSIVYSWYYGMLLPITECKNKGIISDICVCFSTDTWFIIDLHIQYMTNPEINRAYIIHELQVAQQTRDIHPLLVQCWSTVYCAGPTLNQQSQWVHSCIVFAERPSRDIMLNSPCGALVSNDSKSGTLQTRLL